MTSALRAILKASDCWDLFDRHPSWALAGAIAWATMHPEHWHGAVCARRLLTSLRREV